MAKNNQDDILKLIEGLSPEEQQKLIEAIAGNHAKEERKKVRRKHYKKEEQAKEEPREREPRQQKRKKGEYVNEFENSPLFHANKQDVETDKKLWANRAPTERDRPNTYVTVECKRCGKERIDRSLVFRNRNEAGQTEEAAHYCNKCCTTGR